MIEEVLFFYTKAIFGKVCYSKADFNVEISYFVPSYKICSSSKNQCQCEFKENQLFSIQKKQTLRKESIENV